MDIGLKIKKLRKECGITQEQLAEYLRVSPQAVSKWENGSTMPDITLIPSLVSVFETSADALLGIEFNNSDKRENTYKTQYRALCFCGDVAGKCSLMRKALAEFPRNYDFMNNLARSLFYCIKNDDDFNELAALCNRIIRGCHDADLVCSATYTLARAYAKQGDKENALKYANKLPHISYAREYALEWAYDGEDRNKVIQTNTFDAMCRMINGFRGRTGANNGGLFADMGNDLAPGQEIDVYKTVLEILKIVFPDENYLIMNGAAADCHRYIARVYAMEKDKENAMKHLYLAEKYGDKLNESINKNLPYTSIFFDRITFANDGIARHADSSEDARTLRRLREWDCFDFMRGDDEFMEFEERIKEKAKRADIK